MSQIQLLAAFFDPLFAHFCTNYCISWLFLFTVLLTVFSSYLLFPVLPKTRREGVVCGHLVPSQGQSTTPVYNILFPKSVCSCCCMWNKGLSMLASGCVTCGISQCVCCLKDEDYILYLYALTSVGVCLRYLHLRFRKPVVWRGKERGSTKAQFCKSDTRACGKNF